MKIPWNNGKKASPEAIKNQSKSHLGQIAWNKDKKLEPLTEEHKAKISKAVRGEKHPFFGKKLSKEHRRNMSLAKLGKPGNSLGKKRPDYTGDKHPLWKGDEVGYRNLHRWVERNRGKACQCEDCGLNEVPQGLTRYFQWANISKEYKRILSDWKQLCIKCHKAFDGYGDLSVNL